MIQTDSKKKQQMRICICEDIEEHSVNISEICTLLAEEYPLSVEVYFTAEALLQHLTELNKENAEFPNLILMDIELPGMDGITLGKQIKNMSKDVFLVFVTAFVEYAVKGYEANAFRYLLKPVTLEVMRDLMIDIQREYGKRKKLWIKTNDGERMILLEDLIYISAEDKYTVLYTGTQHYLSDNSLTKYEEQLGEFGFFRIHRKYLVNMYHHKAFRAGKVVLTQGYTLPVSGKRMARYQQQLFHFLGEDLA
ncbi:MAG: LytR/AlgR family response regulator transcription factor [Lachnospiraceae bacterium]